MVGPSSFVLSQCWVSSLLLLLVSFSDTGDAMLCYSCSYTYSSAPLVGYECVNATDEVKTANIVHCATGICHDTVVYKKHVQDQFVVSSVSRTCAREPHTGPNCTHSTYEITCHYNCKGEKCNNLDLHYREPPKGGAMASFTHWTFTTIALMALLLNSIF